jgi:hypothetical protein
MKFLLAIFVVLGLFQSILFAQQDQQHTIQLSKETVENLLHVLTPGCSSELESALQYQTEVSYDCKDEIQLSLQTMKDQNSDFTTDEPNARDNAKSQEKLKISATTKPLINPLYSIIGFVLLSIVGISIFVITINKQRDPESKSKKPKKLSKKKVSILFLNYYYCLFKYKYYIITGGKVTSKK